MDGGHQQSPPQFEQQRQNEGRAAVDPGQIVTAHGQKIPKQVAAEVYPYLRHKAQGHQANGQGAVGENAQQGVGGQGTAACQYHQRQGQSHTGAGDGEVEGHLQQKAQGDAQQRGVGKGIAEVGHAAPDHEATQRPGHQGDPQAANQGTPEKVTQDRINERHDGCSPRGGPIRHRCRQRHHGGCADGCGGGDRPPGSQPPVAQRSR